MAQKTYKDYLSIWLDKIKKILKNSNYSYADYDYIHSEWRWNSIKWESDFLESILDDWWENVETNDTFHFFFNKLLNLMIIVPHSARNWFDFWVISDWLFFPINIKISNGNTADNLFWVKVLNYLLFWDYELDKYWMHIPFAQDEIKVAELLWSSYKNWWFINFEQNFNTHNLRDYFFLSINKESWKISIHPFLNIKEEDIKTNPKNAFQINLSNLWYILSNDYDFDENILKLIRKYFEYAEKKAQPYLVLSNVFK